jgi:hypothetical protein
MVLSGWDRVILRPYCFLPPPWESRIKAELDPISDRMAIELAQGELAVDSKAMARYFKQRISIVNKLVETKKLDAKIGKIVTSHFEAHLKELGALQTGPA